MENLHLLRPLWLLTLLPMPLILWWLWRQTRPGQAWEQVCDPHLLPHLLIHLGQRQQRLPLALLGIGWLLVAIALAGPTWEKLPQPTFKSQLARVLVLDLSHSMNATDLNPSRLTLAKYKVQDILKRSEEHQTALIAFAGDVHIVSPLTSDADTIASMVGALSTEIMPAPGSRADLALAKAGELLKQNGSHTGEIILLTDGLDHREASVKAAQSLSEQGYRLSVLAIGTAAGAPIPMQDGGFLKDTTGAIVIPRLEVSALQTLASAGSGMYSMLTNTDSDLNRLLLPASAMNMNEAQENQNQLTESWREEGPWLLLLLLPLAALSFRRGWMLSVMLVATIGLSAVPPPAAAFEWRDLWQRPDQQGATAMQQEQPADAAELFESTHWQGAAHYRAGQYEEAATAYAQSDTVQSHYNRGNALAKGGEIEQAIEAYETALNKDSEHIQARENLELLKKMQEEQKQQQQDEKSQEEQQDQENTDQQNQQQDGDQQKEDSSGDKQESEDAAERESPEQSEEQQAQQNEQGEGEQEEQQAQQQEAEAKQKEGEEQQAAAADAEQSLTEETRQAQLLEQYLNRIPDDPGGLLREKFRRQSLRQRGEAKSDNEQTW